MAKILHESNKLVSDLQIRFNELHKSYKLRKLYKIPGTSKFLCMFTLSIELEDMINNISKVVLCEVGVHEEFFRKEVEEQKMKNIRSDERCNIL